MPRVCKNVFDFSDAPNVLSVAHIHVLPLFRILQSSLLAPLLELLSALSVGLLDFGFICLVDELSDDFLHRP